MQAEVAVDPDLLEEGLRKQFPDARSHVREDQGFNGTAELAETRDGIFEAPQRFACARFEVEDETCQFLPSAVSEASASISWGRPVFKASWTAQSSQGELLPCRSS